MQAGQSLMAVRSLKDIWVDANFKETQLRDLRIGQGGSVGISLGQTITERREQFHLLRLNEGLNKLNPAVSSYLSQVQPTFQPTNGDPVAAQQMAWQSLNNLRQQQASALSYFDAFLIFSVLAVSLAFLVWGMKRSVVPKGTHISAE